ncbi:MAG: DUF4013 domain-containing protein [Pirellulaceae bacterium]
MKDNPFESVAIHPKANEAIKGGHFQLDYFRNFRFLFESSNGFVNLLLCSVIQLIPVIGPIILMGYQYEISESLVRQRGGVYPDFTFDRFTNYLVRGVWPFLVALIVGLTTIPIFFLFWFAFMFAMTAVNFNASPAIAIAIPVGVFFFWIGFILFANLLLIPFSSRAGLGQDFGKSFDFAFARSFIGLVWKELLLGILIIALCSPFIAFAGILLLIVGYFPAIALISMAVGFHHHQLYCLYLSRGGTPIPFKPLEN